jgi:transcriptional regulator with XRE-family HTH domain
MQFGGKGGNKMTIDYGTLIRMRREDLGLSKSALADRAVVHRTTIAKIESGENMSLDIFLSVLQALGLKMEVVEADGQ